MTPERYRRLCELFDQALALAPSERADFLRQLGGGDCSLRAELEGMLAHDEAAGGDRPLPGPCPVNARALLPQAEQATGLAPPPGTAPVSPPRGEGQARPVVPGYEVLAELGRGGMGVVYKARQVGLNRLVALKMIRGLALADDGEVRRFLREARAAALSHPGIVPVHEVGEFAGCHFYSMDLVGGGSLADRLAAGPLPPEEAARLLRAVCEAVAFAHAHGIVHRDLKPANILLDEQGRPQVSDFGLAKWVGVGPEAASLTGTGAVLGTPSYMAPEQAAGRGDEVGVASDVYALGAVLYELLTGRPPFRAATPLETLAQVLDSPAAPPRLLNGAVPADLEAICLKCLQKGPRDRYASASDLADDLGRYLEGVPVRADAGRVFQLLRPWLRESRHADILRIRARAWVWQGPIAFVTLLLTNVLIWAGYQSPLGYVALWTTGLAVWLIPSWHYVLRRAQEWSAVEKQVHQVVCFSLVASGLLLATSLVNGAAPLQLLSAWVVLFGLGVGCIAVVLRGTFYLLAALCGLSAVVVAGAPSFGPVAFGAALGVGLFAAGWRNLRPAPAAPSQSGAGGEGASGVAPDPAQGPPAVAAGPAPTPVACPPPRRVPPASVDAW